MKLRTERLIEMRGDEATINDAMAAHALMRVMGAYAEYFGSHIKRIQSDADELMREWTGEPTERRTLEGE